MVPKKKVTKDKNSKKSEIKKNIIKKTQLKNQTFVCLLCKFTLASEATGAPVGHAKQELPHRANPLASDILHLAVEKKNLFTKGRLLGRLDFAFFLF